jgi:hypothetical protein
MYDPFLRPQVPSDDTRVVRTRKDENAQMDEKKDVTRSKGGVFVVFVKPGEGEAERKSRPGGCVLLACGFARMCRRAYFASRREADKALFCEGVGNEPNHKTQSCCNEFPRLTSGESTGRGGWRLRTS